jgi:hypothetical protein
MTPSTVTAQKVERQPNCWPSAVPPGTPSTLATVSPVNISAIALACFSFGTREAATTEPTPKNAPCARAAMMRPVISTPYVPARAETRLPAMKTPIRDSSTVLRETFEPIAVSSGAPTTTPSA